MGGTLCTAPGKLMLMGEYAVLEGAPAIVWAVQPRVTVRVRSFAPGSSEKSWVRADPPGFQTHYRIRHGAWQWLHASTAQRDYLRLVPIVAASVLLECRRWRACGIHIDSQQLFKDSRKLGYGSSAAVCVAVLAALRHWHGLSVRCEELLSAAVGLHRQAQNGKGSGADVAASLYGGSVEYQIVDGEPHCRLVPPPTNLFVHAIEMDASADTRQLVGGVKQFAKAQPATYDAMVAVMKRVADDAAKAYAAGDGSGFLTAVDAYASCLAELGNKADIRIITDRMRDAERLIRSVGGTFKSSGAGGGDFALAMVDSTDKHEAVSQLLHEGAFRFYSLEPNAAGMHIEANGDI